MDKKKIIVIDDDQEILDLIVESLTSVPQFEVQASMDAQWVLDNIDLNNIDCIITDVLMPKMSGIELIRRIYEKNFSPTVYFMTGYSDISRESLNEYRPKAIIFKPFDVDEATVLIKSHLLKS